MRRLAIALVVFGVMATRAPAAAEEGLGGARALQEAREAILDGRLDDAERLLRTAEEPVDPVEAALLHGLIALQREDMDEAARRFEEVVAAEPDRAVAWIYLAHARLARDDHQGALDALSAAGSLGEEIAGVTLLRARALEGTGRPRDALEAIRSGLERLPGSAELMEELVFFHLRAGLSLSAVDAAERYREQVRAEPRAWILLAEALRLGRRDEDASLVLEEARLRFPESSEVTEQLAYTYAIRRRPLSAARLYESLALRGGTHAFAIADQLRLAGDHDGALRWNARVADEKARLDQRLAILVGDGRFARAVVVGVLADARGVLDDASLHTLGYAAVLAGRGQLATELSDRLRRAGLDERAERLDALIARCREEPWLCQ